MRRRARGVVVGGRKGGRKRVSAGIEEWRSRGGGGGPGSGSVIEEAVILDRLWSFGPSGR